MGMDIKKIFESASTAMTNTEQLAGQMSAEVLSDLGVDLKKPEKDLLMIGEEVVDIFGDVPDEYVIADFSDDGGETSSISELINQLNALMNQITSNSTLVQDIVNAYKANAGHSTTADIVETESVDETKIYNTTNIDLNQSLSPYNKKTTINNLESKTAVFDTLSEKITTLLNDMKASMLANQNLDSEIINTIFKGLNIEYAAAIVASRALNIMGNNFESLVPYGISISMNDGTYTVSISQTKIANKVKEAYIALETQFNHDEEQNKLDNALSSYYVGSSLPEQTSLAAALSAAQTQIMSILDDMSSSMISAGLDRTSVSTAINNTKSFYTTIISSMSSATRSNNNILRDGIQVNVVQKDFMEAEPSDSLNKTGLRDSAALRYVVLLDVGAIADKVKDRYNNGVNIIKDVTKTIK